MEETLYQQGLCPKCHRDAQQRFLFATDDCAWPVLECGKVTGYARIRTLSLFRCEGCKTTLFYETMLEDEDRGYSLDSVDLSNPQWVVGLDDFRKLSTLVYSTPEPPFREAVTDGYFQQNSISSKRVSHYAPDQVREIYERASKVKSEPNSFAVQIRRALEAICIDKGESGRNLNDDLIRLSKAGVFPPIVVEIAHELRDIGNVGAHVKSEEVEAGQVQAIDGFFHLVITYAYVAPALLADYRERLRPGLPEIISEDAVN